MELREADLLTPCLPAAAAYLDLFGASLSAQQSEISIQKLFKEPKKVVEKYAVGEDSESGKKNMVALNWLLTDKPLDLETELALGFLDNLLLGTPAAPLRKALMESGLGESIVGGGIEDELRQPQFSIGMKGVADENIQKVEDLIFSTFKKLVDEGFTDEAVEASINSVEFSLRENNTGSFPRGLSLMLRSMVSASREHDDGQALSAVNQKHLTPLLSSKRSNSSEEGVSRVFCSACAGKVVVWRGPIRTSSVCQAARGV